MEARSLPRSKPAATVGAPDSPEERAIMADQDSIWFRLGYTLERARGAASAAPRLRSLEERDPRFAGDDEPRAARKVGERPTRRPGPGRGLEVELDDADVSDEELAAAIAEQGDEPPPESARRERAAAAPESAAGALNAWATFLQGISPTGEPWEAVIAAVGTTLVGRLLESMPRKRTPTVARLLHAAAAGAGAALAREALRPVTSARSTIRPLAERAKGAGLAGAARGLLYGGLIEPRLPGPPIVRGAIYGAVEHVAAPMGGLTHLAGARAPHRNIPILSDLFDDLEPSDETLLEHVLFGIAMAALYGARPADADRDDEDDREG